MGNERVIGRVEKYVFMFFLSLFFFFRLISIIQMSETKTLEKRRKMDGLREWENLKPFLLPQVIGFSGEWEWEDMGKTSTNTTKTEKVLFLNLIRYLAHQLRLILILMQYSKSTDVYQFSFELTDFEIMFFNQHF